MEAGVRRNYKTLSETITDLKNQGYHHDFNIANVFSAALSPKDFEIDRVHRFEGASNPDDQCILYAISSSKLGVKGILVNGYGISAVDETNELVSMLGTHP
jgi:hypothetical protein